MAIDFLFLILICILFFSFFFSLISRPRSHSALPELDTAFVQI